MKRIEPWLHRTVVRGVVTDENGNAVEGAQVRVEGVGKHVTTSSRYHNIYVRVRHFIPGFR